ncbi:MAG: divalent-cation tolerance protein CutA [Lentisphaerae bacterium]|nr:divalent-cation tolerance protein CutA [Lentisphaerota bacterium]
MRSSNLIVVQTTVASAKAARSLAKAIVQARLAACIQVSRIHSTYRWRNRIEHAAEWLLTAKTRRASAKALMAFIRRHHPYEVPEIVAFNIAHTSRAYGAWVLAETKP